MSVSCFRAGITGFVLMRIFLPQLLLLFDVRRFWCRRTGYFFLTRFENNVILGMLNIQMPWSDFFVRLPDARTFRPLRYSFHFCSIYRCAVSSSCYNHPTRPISYPECGERTGSMTRRQPLKRKVPPDPYGTDTLHDISLRG